ncbi:hypothetical protein MMC30_002839 [Trapelia coarctata]|nr:hypothetical protein [Trapelia coarctata]
MAPSQPPPSKNRPPPKLKRLPPHAHISKRPLLHPAIPSPYTSASQKKILYISARTPFISAVKRIRKLLSLIDEREVGQIDLAGGKSGRNGKGSERQKLGKKAGKEEVFLKGTGRAIEKVLGLALFFEGQEDVKVRVGTGSVGVVDDIVEGDRPEKGEEQEEGGGQGNMDVDREEENEEDEELPETQIRKASFVEVAISLR